MTYIIAEIGNNHEGSRDTAISLVREAISTGAHAVKMQLFKADKLVDKSMPSLVGTHKTQYERMKALELPFSTYVEAADICHDLGVDFIVTPFDEDSTEAITPYVDKIKIASGDITYHPMLNAAANANRHIILSTGMAKPLEINEAIDITHAQTILHCTSLYPTEITDANLSLIRTYRHIFGDRCRIGYSDHTIGEVACLAAVAMGATVIEKHFKGSETGSQGDFRHSMDTDQFTKMVDHIEDIHLMRAHHLERPDIESRRFLRRGANGLRGTYK